MTEGVDWFLLNFIRKDEKDKRNIYSAKCLRCGKVFDNHSSLKNNLATCPIENHQQTITDFLRGYYSPNIQDIDITTDQEILIYFFVLFNISIKSIDNPIAISLFIQKFRN